MYQYFNKKKKKKIYRGFYVSLNNNVNDIFNNDNSNKNKHKHRQRNLI